MIEPAWETLGPDPLGENYDPIAYWRLAGEIYEQTFAPEMYAVQETVLALLLSRMQWQTVLDVGCGFGRLGGVISRVRPGASYTGLDVSPPQIAAAERHWPDAEFHCAPILDWEPGERRWDLVISAEVLMHQPDEIIGPTVQRMLGWAGRWLVTVDACDGETNAWNRLHDYASLYGDRLVEAHRVDNQMIWIVSADSQSEEMKIA